MGKLINSPVVHEKYLITLIKVIILDDNTYFLQKAFDLFNLVDIGSFVNTQQSTYVLLKAGKSISSSKLKGVTDKSLIYDSFIIEIDENCRGLSRELIAPLLLYENDDELKLEEISVVKKTVYKLVQQEVVFNELDELYKVMDSLMSGEYLDYDESMNKFKLLINRLKALLDNMQDFSEKKIIHTSESMFIDSIRDSYDELQKDKTYLLTGIKALNNMVHIDGKGFGPKLYIFVALVSSFKSALLMYLTMWFKKYNSHKFDDVIKRKLKPTVVYLSLENEPTENLERFFYMFTKEKITNNSLGDTISKTVNHIIDDNEIDITIIHGKPDEYSVNDLINLDKQLEMNGYYTIAWCIDYMRLLRDDRKEKDLRLRLGNITQDLRNMATLLKKPIITAHHTNREADIIIETAKETGQSNYTKKLGASVISESKLIDNYADVIIYIAIEKPANSNKTYLGLKRGKIRYEASDTTFFVHEIHGGIILKDDINLSYSLSKKSVDEIENKSIWNSNNVNKDIEIKEEINNDNEILSLNEENNIFVEEISDENIFNDNDNEIQFKDTTESYILN